MRPRLTTTVVVLVMLMVLAARTTPADARVQTGSAPEPAVAASVVDETQPVDVPAPSAQATEYHESGNRLWAFNQFWSFLIPIIVLATGFSAWLRDVARKVGRNWFFTLAVYWILFTLISAVVDLPLSYYEEFVRQHAYGLSNQTFQKWASDSVKSLALGCLIGPLVLWVPYLLLKKSPTRWWLYSAFALMPFVIVGILVAPIWIAPLFNKFQPMQDKALETKILGLASRAGIEGSKVFEVDKSADTKMLNAYVAGMFGTKRIVLWDTTIKRMNERELLFVMGHEMGHYALGHTRQMLLLSLVTIMLSFYAAYRAADGILARWGGRFGFATLADIASLPLLGILLSAFSFVIGPAELAFSRHLEHEADRFGLEITQSNHSAATAFVKLQTDALAVPRPGLLFTIWRENHPSLGDRIDFANAYHPWRSGEPLVYGDRFTK